MIYTLDAVNARLDLVTQLLSGGTLDIVSTDNTILATLTLPSPLAPPATGGVLTFNAIEPGIAIQNGHSQSIRLSRANGTLMIIAGAAEVVINPPDIIAGGMVYIDALTITE